MKTLIVILILAAFLQTTILPINLVLLILICRAYLKSEKENLYLAFAFGFFTAHLDLINLGLNSIMYLLIIQATQQLSKWSFSGHPLLIVPISFVLLFFYQFVNDYIAQQGLIVQQIIFTALISLPIFFLIRLWEDRFVVKKDIKLKI